MKSLSIGIEKIIQVPDVMFSKADSSSDDCFWLAVASDEAVTGWEVMEEEVGMLVLVGEGDDFWVQVIGGGISETNLG